MGNTFFYHQVKNDIHKITWKEIFSESFKPHTKQDRDYAMAAGMSISTATEADMLQKWKKPFLWFDALKGGVVLAIVLLLLSYFVKFDATLLMVAFIIPMIVPLVMMILVWELNIPRNISFFEMLLYLVGGAVISFIIVSLLGNFVTSDKAIFAPVTEEPAKLIASSVFLYIYSKKRKIYGVTGLAIGAAVGAGFAGFEAIQYVFHGGISISIILLRAYCAFGSHVFYCAPYMGALALGMKDGRFQASAFVTPDFLLMFAAGCGVHAFNNSEISILDDPRANAYLVVTICIVALWLIALYMTKKCLQQVVSLGRYLSGQGVNSGRYMAEAAVSMQDMEGSATLIVSCVSGVLKGAVWKLNGQQSLIVGRSEECQLRFPSMVNGVSRQHCSIQRTSQGWTVRDLNSSNGTYTGNGRRLAPGIDVVLKNGDFIYIGGKENVLQICING